MTMKRIARVHHGRIAATAAVLVLGALVACGRSTPRGLVIITLDTTRADRLPVYGFDGIATPAIDGLAHDSVVFDTATTVAPLTLTAHTSLFTGLYPPRHGVRDNADRPLDASHATLAEMLRRRGFRTGAFVGSMVLGAQRGLSRGFDVYHDGGAPGVAPPRRRSAGDVVDDARQWIDGLGESPFFLWVHFYDAHAPQNPPIEYRKLSGDPYEAAVAYVDVEIGRLVAALAERHRLETSVIVIAADHGESLGEHGEAEHGIFLYESVMRVPLIVRAPGVAPRRASDLVSLVDIVPTVLDLFGIGSVPLLDGVSVRPALVGRALPPRVVYAESTYPQRFGWSPLRMVRDAHFKYVDAPRPELYDLDRDPLEEQDVHAERPAIAAALRQRLEEINGPTQPRATSPSLETTDAGALRSLGYVSSSPAPSQSAAADPKDHIQEYNVMRIRADR
jgi:arylsulfatase A-like enzyme